MTKKGFMAHTNSIIIKTDRKYLVVNWVFIPSNDQNIERFRLRYTSYNAFFLQNHFNGSRKKFLV